MMRRIRTHAATLGRFAREQVLVRAAAAGAAAFLFSGRLTLQAASRSINFAFLAWAGVGGWWLLRYLER